METNTSYLKDQLIGTALAALFFSVLIIIALLAV